MDFNYDAAGRESRVDRYTDRTRTTNAGHTDHTYDTAGRTSRITHYDAENHALAEYGYRSNVQHPTYKAFAELGKAVKTIFLCRYLHSKELRRESHEGLNVIEQWNGTNDFVFFARRGELASNGHEDHEISMLALHLLQNCYDLHQHSYAPESAGEAALVAKAQRQRPERPDTPDLGARDSLWPL